jgi:hypothetical protein
VTKIKSIFVLCKNGNQSFFNAKGKKLKFFSTKQVSCYKEVSFYVFVKQMEIQVLWMQKCFVFRLITNFDLMEK